MQSVFSSCYRAARVLDRHIVSLAFVTIVVIWLGVLPPAVFAQGAGYWHAGGSQLLDENGKAVRLAGVNWYGIETADQLVNGVWPQEYNTILNDVKKLSHKGIVMPYTK